MITNSGIFEKNDRTTCRGDTCDIATLILAHDESPNIYIYICVYIYIYIYIYIYVCIYIICVCVFNYIYIYIYISERIHTNHNKSNAVKAVVAYLKQIKLELI